MKKEPLRLGLWLLGTLLSMVVGLGVSCSKMQESSSGLGRTTLPPEEQDADLLAQQQPPSVDLVPDAASVDRQAGEEKKEEKKSDGEPSLQESPLGAAGDSSSSLLRRGVKVPPQGDSSPLCLEEGGCGVMAGCLLDQTIHTLEVVFEADEPFVAGWEFSLPVANVVAEKETDQAKKVSTKKVQVSVKQLDLILDGENSVALSFKQEQPFRSQILGFQGKSLGDISSLNLRWTLKQSSQLEKQSVTELESEEALSQGVRSQREETVRDLLQDSGSLASAHHGGSLRLFKKVSLLVNGRTLYEVPWELFHKSLAPEGEAKSSAGESSESLSTVELYHLSYVHSLDASKLADVLASTSPEGLGEQHRLKIRQHIGGFYFYRYLYEQGCGRGYDYLQALIKSFKKI